MNNQTEAFEKFSKLKIGALFMKMGSGKTKVAIDLANYNKDRYDLVVFTAPNSTLENLQVEISKWKLEKPVTVISYERISQSDRSYLDLLEEIKNKKLFLIADESIFIKNDSSKRFNRLVEISKYSEYRLILNGTPLARDEWDLYNQMYFLSPKIIGMSRLEFLSHFFDYHKIKRSGEKAREYYTFSQINADYLKKLILPYVYECDLSFSLKESQDWRDMPSSSNHEYTLAKEKMLEGIYKGHGVARYLVQLAKINANDSNKNKEIATFVDGRQVICYCSFVKEAKMIANQIDCFFISGSTPQAERDEILKAFEISQKPLVMTYGVGSFGLNLQFCNEIVFSSLMFDFAKVEQAKYRIKRVGQTRNIKYTYFRTDLKICQLIEKNIDKKQSLHDLVKQKLDWKEVV